MWGTLSRGRDDEMRDDDAIYMKSEEFSCQGYSPCSKCVPLIEAVLSYIKVFYFFYFFDCLKLHFLFGSCSFGRSLQWEAGGQGGAVGCVFVLAGGDEVGRGD